MTGGVPVSVDDIDAPWLSKVLLDGGLDVEVAGVDVERIALGEGMLGQLARLTLRYDRAAAGAPASLIAKLPTDAEQRAVADMLLWYEREARFYGEVAGTVPVRVPRCYANVHDGDSYALLLEDLTPYRRIDQVTGANADQAVRIVTMLARLHARFWQAPELDEWSWLPSLSHPVHKTISPRFTAGWPNFCERYGHKIPPRTRAWVEQFAPLMDHWLDEHDAPPFTLCHGDLRLDNLLWSPSGDPVLLDWQLMMRAPGGVDVAYFLFWNLPVDVRRASEDHLLDVYRTALRSAGVDAPSCAGLRELYRETVLFYTAALACLLDQFDAGNERGRAMFDTLVERIFTAADDLDVGELIASYRSRC